MLKTEKYRLLGCPCIPIDSIEAAHKLLAEAVSAEAYGYSVAINAEKIMLYRRNPELCQAVEQASLPYPDGAGAVLSLKWLHGKRSSKVDLPKIALGLANTNRWKLFVLGSQEEVNRIAFDKIKQLYPEIQLVGRLNGYESEERIIHAIEEASPQLVLAALGSPKQELFAYRMRNMLVRTFMIGCGGALDTLAGRRKRPPDFIKNNYLEWLYALYKEPWRWKRELRLFSFFLYLVRERFLRQEQPHFGDQSHVGRQGTDPRKEVQRPRGDN